jgi:hypothetical protein
MRLHLHSIDLNRHPPRRSSRRPAFYSSGVVHGHVWLAVWRAVYETVVTAGEVTAAGEGAAAWEVVVGEGERVVVGWARLDLLGSGKQAFHPWVEGAAGTWTLAWQHRHPSNLQEEGF